MIDWQNIEPRHWPSTTGFHSQTCGACGLNMQDRVITNVRGVWEHLMCAQTAYYALREVKFTTCTQRDVIDALKKHGHIEATCDLSKPDTGRYAWRPLGGA